MCISKDGDVFAAAAAADDDGVWLRLPPEWVLFSKPFAFGV